jgi:hypothetical protein
MFPAHRHIGSAVDRDQVGLQETRAAERDALNKLDYKGEDPKNLPPPDPLIVGRAHLNAVT